MDQMGKTVINDEVFVDLAKAAMLNVNEVSCQERKGAWSGIAQIFADRFTPQISVKKDDSEEQATVAFDLKLALLYGVNIPETVKRVREAILKDVEELTGYKVEKIDISVEKLVKPETIKNIEDE